MAINRSVLKGSSFSGSSCSLVSWVSDNMWALVILLALYSWLTYSFRPAAFTVPKVKMTHSTKPTRFQLFKSSERKDSRNTLVPLKMNEDPEATEKKGPEQKYVIAGLVFLAACVFDFYRMHGGVPFWAPGGVL